MKVVFQSELFIIQIFKDDVLMNPPTYYVALKLLLNTEVQEIFTAVEHQPIKPAPYQVALTLAYTVVFIIEQLGDKFQLIIDDKYCALSLVSTIIKLIFINKEQLQLVVVQPIVAIFVEILVFKMLNYIFEFQNQMLPSQQPIKPNLDKIEFAYNCYWKHISQIFTEFF
ncbi:Hypothetical_protein [Hexamita inflata]|uniref:Hypothetical_protein n=1 Tax=Hexamita inflata TaxID=28002 RepID=A0ABP1IKZ8_9EUKA